ncbi:MAG: hypothetical protein JNK11_19235 [Alphaproteobacteria bacterium]|nr:hypothetical protein [Alphaproteobacteria bacterium]
MPEIKEIIEKARFAIAKDVPFEAYLVKGEDVKTADFKTPFQMLFSIRDLLVDAVMLPLRPTPEMNTWKKRLPFDVIAYAYKMLPFRRMTFVWDTREDKSAKTDYIVCVFQDKDVKPSPDYEALYKKRAAALPPPKPKITL